MEIILLSALGANINVTMMDDIFDGCSYLQTATVTDSYSYRQLVIATVQL